MTSLGKGQRVRIVIGTRSRRVEAEVVYVDRRTQRVVLRFTVPAGPSGERAITCERHFDDCRPLFTET